MVKIVPKFDEKKIYTVKDIITAFDVNRRTVTNWIKNGWLKAENIGATGAQTRWRITGKALNEFGDTAFGERWGSLRGENWKRIHAKL